MDCGKVGKAIAFLRKRAGYTQKDLADRLGISDKAVSKWERGLSLPDISYFGKLAILLDTDSDSLLLGDVIHHDSGWNGLLVLPENRNGICVGAMVFDKPLVYFLIGYFLLVGIKSIFVICGAADEAFMLSEFGNGERLGIQLTYCGNQAENISQILKSQMNCTNVMTVFGRSFIYGVDQTRFFQKAMLNNKRLTILSLPKKSSENKQPLYFDEDGKIVDSDDREKVITQYEYHEIPLCFCPKDTLLKIASDMNGHFTLDLQIIHECREPVFTEVLDRGYIVMDMNTPDDIVDTACIVRMIQKACGMNIYCLEEIAWRRGMIDLSDMDRQGSCRLDTEYGRYILNLK